MVQPIPSMHLVQAKADEISHDGYDVHTVHMVLWDGSLWQITIEATNEETLEEWIGRYDLDLYGYHLTDANMELRR